MNYQLTQTGEQVQDILNQAPTTEETLQAEITRSTNKDDALELAIGNEKTRAEGVESNLQTAIGNEITRAEGAEVNLQTAIGNEKTRAELVEGALRTDVDGINAKIPASASSENKLATESFVNSSISTNTADFKGTYTSLEQLQTEVHDANANDYAFVISTDAAGNTAYNRYKYVEGTGWVYEYTLNNSSFTSAQWAAINSAITAVLVAKLTGLPTATELTTQLNAIIDSLATEKSRAEGIESGLRTDVNANATAIGTEKTRAEGVEGTLSTAIGNEKTRAEGAELVLQQNINAEALLRSNADTALQTGIDGINAKIPAAASSSNQLADKAFVNSSIATNTAEFKGTYNSLAELQAVTGANANDYGFVISTDSAGNTVYNRYKYVEGTGWVFEYALNNSSFTAAQWASIQSGITAALVAKLNGLPDIDALNAMFAAITSKIPANASSSNKLVDYAQLVAALAGKQDTLIFDNVPTENSNNPVKSSGVYTAIATVTAAVVGLQSSKQDVLTFDQYPTAGSNNPVKSTGIYTAIENAVEPKADKTDLDNAVIRISTNEVDIAQLQAAYRGLTQNNVVPVAPTDPWPVANPQLNVIYRVTDRTNTPPQYYTDYMWNGTVMVEMAQYDNAIDSRPKKDSQNLVTSGGVFDNMGAMDVSELNATENPHTLATYVDLSAALAAIPSDYQKGGMSIKFVQSSDNKYVQYRYMGIEITGNPNSFLDPANWQENIEVKNSEIPSNTLLPYLNIPKFLYWVNATVCLNIGFHRVIATNGAKKLYIKRGTDNFYIHIVKSYHSYSSGEAITDYATGETRGRYISTTVLQEITLPDDAKYIIIGVNLNDTETRTPDVLQLDKYDVLKGVVVQINNIPDDSISSSKLKGGSVTFDKIAENAVNSVNINNKSVTPEKASFFTVGKNLFDYHNAKAGTYISSNGSEGENPVYYCSDYIEIDSSENNVVSNKYGTSGSYNCFYDEAKEFIAGSAFQTATSDIPENARYVRFSFPNVDATTVQQIQVEYGTESTVFEPYKILIDSKFLPTSSEKNENRIITPRNWYLLSDVNNDIFYEPILKKWNPYRFDVFAETLPNGRNYVKAIKRVVTLNNPTATSIRLNLYDVEAESFVQSKTVSFRKGTQGIGNSEIKVGIIGDSYTDGGCFTPALLAHSYVPNLKLVGTRQVLNYPLQCTDGRSGWMLNSFFSVFTNADYFNPFYHPQGIHRYWGSVGFWAGVCGGNPTENQSRYTQYSSLCDSNGWPITPSDGDVIYDSTNSSFKEYQSGSWITVQQTDYTWEFDYVKYLLMWSIETPDILCVMLGVNDFWVLNYPTDENLDIWKTQMNTIMASYKASNPNGKFVILTANTVTHPTANHYRPLDVHNRMQILREFIINEWDDKENEGVYVVDTAQLIDSEHAYTLAEYTPFDGYYLTDKATYANDGQHPRINYSTLGYSLAAFIQYMR